MKRFMIGIVLLSIVALTLAGWSGFVHSRATAQSAGYYSGFGQIPQGYYGTYSLGQRPPLFNLSSQFVWVPYNWSQPTQLLYDQNGYYNAWTGPLVVPSFGETGSRFGVTRTNDAIEVTRDKDGLIVVKWQGEPRAVSRMNVALLDASRNSVSEQAITQQPVEAKLTPTDKTKFYRLIIEYIDGTTTSVLSQIEPAVAEPKAAAEPKSAPKPK